MTKSWRKRFLVFLGAHGVTYGNAPPREAGETTEKKNLLRNNDPAVTCNSRLFFFFFPFRWWRRSWETCRRRRLFLHSGSGVRGLGFSLLLLLLLLLNCIDPGRGSFIVARHQSIIINKQMRLFFSSLPHPLNVRSTYGFQRTIDQVVKLSRRYYAVRPLPFALSLSLSRLSVSTLSRLSFFFLLTRSVYGQQTTTGDTFLTKNHDADACLECLNSAETKENKTRKEKKQKKILKTKL